jgi:hypothetical protein
MGVIYDGGQVRVEDVNEALKASLSKSRDLCGSRLGEDTLVV